MRDDLRGYVLEQLGTSDAIVVIDKTSFPKRGCKSVGASRCNTVVPVGKLRTVKLASFSPTSPPVPRIAQRGWGNRKQSHIE